MDMIEASIQFLIMATWIVNFFMLSFISHTKVVPAPKLLILDGHGSHLTWVIIPV